MKTLRLVLYCLLLLIAGMVGFIMGALLLGEFSPNMLLEMISGETPQAKITRYLRAIQAQDRGAALDAWLIPSADSAETFTKLSERRNLVTNELLARKITGFTIFEPQWWRTCCDPGVTQHARNAGGARVKVQVLDGDGQPWVHTFDIFTNGPYLAIPPAIRIDIGSYAMFIRAVRYPFTGDCYTRGKFIGPLGDRRY